MKRFSTLFLFFLSSFFLLSLRAQPVVFGNLQEYVGDIIDGMPGSSGNQFTNLGPSQEEDWRELFGLIAEGDFAEAAATASGLQYRFVRFIDNSGATNEEFYLLERISGGVNYWGTYLFKPNACRKLVVQCPHPILDSNTGVQGIFVYQGLDAYAFFLSGTHRCNHISPSGCSGTTSVCGASAPYRRSDVAHNTLAGFHIATEVLYDRMPELYFVQLHGFARQGADPHVIMSNGSRDIPVTDLAAAIRDGLLAADPALTFKIGHLDLGWSRLLAFTNTQGRYINDSSEPCTQNADIGNGHFIHIEQEFSRLRAGETQWAKMQDALADAFECTQVAATEPDAGEVYWHQQPDGALQFNLPEGANYTLVLYNWLGQRLGQRRIGAHDTFSATEGAGVFVILADGQWMGSGKIIGKRAY